MTALFTLSRAQFWSSGWREDRESRLRKDWIAGMIRNFVVGLTLVVISLALPGLWSNVKPNEGASHRQPTAAVLGTGVNYALPDLEGRIVKGIDTYNRDFDPMDDNGSGTRLARSVINLTEGDIVAVKVLPADGPGTIAELAEGLRWIIDTYEVGWIYADSWVNYRYSELLNLIAEACSRGTTVVGIHLWTESEHTDLGC